MSMMRILRALIVFLLVKCSLLQGADATEIQLVKRTESSWAHRHVHAGLTTPSVKKPTNSPPSAALRVRGGAVVDPLSAAKVMSSVCLLRGLVGFLAPETTMETYYKIKNGGAMTKLLVEDVAGMISIIGVATYASLFHGCSAKTSIGLGGIPFLLTWCRVLLNGGTAKAGMPDRNAVVLSIVALVQTYAGLFDPGWADKALNFLSYFFTVNSIGMVAPNVWASGFGISNLNKVDVALHRMLASVIGGLGLFMVGLLKGEVVPKSLAYAISPALVNLLAMKFVWKDADEAGMTNEMTAFWSLLFGAYMAIVLL